MTSLAVSYQKPQVGTNEEISKIDAFSVANRDGDRSTNEFGNNSLKKSSNKLLKNNIDTQPFEFKPIEEELKL